MIQFRYVAQRINILAVEGRQSAWSSASHAIYGKATSAFTCLLVVTPFRGNHFRFRFSILHLVSVTQLRAKTTSTFEFFIRLPCHCRKDPTPLLNPPSSLWRHLRKQWVTLRFQAKTIQDLKVTRLERRTFAFKFSIQFDTLPASACHREHPAQFCVFSFLASRTKPEVGSPCPWVLPFKVKPKWNKHCKEQQATRSSKVPDSLYSVLSRQFG